MSEILNKETLATLTPQLGDFIAKAPSGEEIIQRFRSTNSVIIKCQTEESQKQAQASLDMAGIRHVAMHYNPLDDLEEATSEETTNPKKFREYVDEVLAEKNSQFIIDTNILDRHYIRNLFSTLLGEDLWKFTPLKIPRLTILEIERRVNQWDDQKNMKKEEKRAQKRLNLYAAREILYLKKELGATLLPELRHTTLETFSRIAGERFTDAWIRREIFEYLNPPDAQESKPAIFMTCDFMNALAAVAENLPVLYFSKTDEQQSYEVRNEQQVAELILALAISFDRIHIGSIAYDGLWEGKSIQQWQEDCVKRSMVSTTPQATQTTTGDNNPP